tara:strand:- start:445 stop:567 length:123 start_codon:yes stop_codon:yes gene_type:complete
MNDLEIIAAIAKLNTKPDQTFSTNSAQKIKKINSTIELIE